MGVCSSGGLDIDDPGGQAKQILEAVEKGINNQDFLLGPFLDIANYGFADETERKTFIDSILEN